MNYLLKLPGVTAKFDEIIDLSNLDKQTLIKICDVTKLTDQDLAIISQKVKKNNQCFSLFREIYKCLILDPVNPLNYQNIDYSQFSIDEKQKMLYVMLENYISSDKICCLLQNMIGSVDFDMNMGFFQTPLINCIYNERFDLVKLLIETCHADINRSSYNGFRPIICSAEIGNLEITKYLYDKGAETNLECRDLKQITKPEIREMISKWEKDKLISEIENKIKLLNHDYNEIMQKLKNL